MISQNLSKLSPIALAVACNAAEVQSTGEEITDTAQEVCLGDEYTETMLSDWAEAEMFRRDCWNEVQATADLCELEAELNGESVQDCWDIEDAQEKSCERTFAMWVNTRPARQCGAYIFEIGTDEEGNNTVEGMIEEDTDGDGVSNRWEFSIGLNPCSEMSFASDECMTDGERDDDFDGIPNEQDENPLCPEGYEYLDGTSLSDCV